MNDLLKFWKYIKNTWDAEEIASAAEESDFDTAKLKQSNIAQLIDDDITTLFGEVIDFIIDGFGIDNYGEVYDMLIGAGIDENRVQEILDA